MLQQIQASKYRSSCLGFLLHLWTPQTCASATCASLANSDKSSGLRHKIQAPSESFFSFWIFSTVQWEMIGKSFPGKPSSLYFLKRVRIKSLHFEAVWQNKTKKKFWFTSIDFSGTSKQQHLRVSLRLELSTMANLCCTAFCLRLPLSVYFTFQQPPSPPHTLLFAVLHLGIVVQ